LLGVNQGIKLDKVRTKIEEQYDEQELVESESGQKTVPNIEVPKRHVEQSTQVDSVHTELKPTQNIESAKPNINAQSIPDGKGYEWYTDGQDISWYRNEDSNSEWQRFET
jgi:glutaredoxin